MTNTSSTSEKKSGTTTRRRFVAMAGTGVGVALGAALCARGEHDETERILKPGDKIDLTESPQEIAEKAYKLGYEYEKKYGGCAQCAVAALQDAMPFVPVDQDVFRAASCLDGGATPQGVQNCGSFTGIGIVIGHLCGRTRDKEFQGGTQFSHDVIRKVYARFEEDYGSVLCKDVKEKMKADCPQVVGKAARWTAQTLLEEFVRHAGDSDKSGEPEQSAGEPGAVLKND